MKFDLSRKKQFYLMLSMFYALFLLAAFIVQFFLNYSFKLRSAEILAASGRAHLVVRSLRRLEELALHQIESLQTFDRIEIASQAVLGSQVLGYGKVAESWLWQQCLQQDVYFDSERVTPLGEFVFCYQRFEGSSLVLIASLIVLLTMLPLTARYRRNLEASLLKDKEAAIGRISRQISHDLRGPLSAMERLLHLPAGTAIDAQRTSIQNALYRFHGMIESLRTNDAELIVRPIRVEAVWELGWESLKGRALQSGKVLHRPQVDCREPLTLDPAKFERVWFNLVSNALDAAAGQVFSEFIRRGNAFILRVKDDGPGLSPKLQPRLFERGFTYQKPGGSGLGLAYVRAVMQGHGGEVFYARQEGLTVFECLFPDAYAAPQCHQQKLASSREGLHRVAICLDPPALSERIREQLTERAMKKYSFCGNPEGAEILVSNIDAILLAAIDRDELEVLQVGRKMPEAQIHLLLMRRFGGPDAALRPATAP